MGDKKLKNGQVKIGEIKTIRDILVGDQFKAFENRLQVLEDEVFNIRNEMDASLKDLKHTLKLNGKNVRMDMLKKIVDLENRLVRGQEKTAQKMKNDKLNQAAKLSKLFIKIGKDIKPN